MVACPNCKKTVAAGAKNCPACGQLMPAAKDGTLDVGQHFDDVRPSAKSPTGTIASNLKPAEDAAHGTLGTPEIASGPDNAGSVQSTAQFEPATPQDDPHGTVPLPESISSGQDTGTVEYGEQVQKETEAGEGKSGTAGRLKRMWKGVAGSSANPMHTLKGDDAMASDSVFARVARRVLVTDTAIEIAESAGTSTSSQPNRRARVKECITIACRAGENEMADYDVTGFLGQGAMGVVLKAHQRAIGRDVAIKMIQPASGQSLSSSNAQKRKFFYEAQITGKLDHPNIVPVYELGVSNEILFYSMKMIVGQEWKEAIQTKTRDENLDILTKVSDAMAFAHQKQIIHRDLKPENVMLGPFGEVLVTDWGCAVDLSRGEKFTGAGSPPWMAPEMADQDNSKIGPRSDIYLLGAMLYQIIAGFPPHPGTTVIECLISAQKNIIIPLKTEDPLLDIALRAMETDPADRYQSVEAMQDAIREYRRHAESIKQTERSEELLGQAIASKDYERFSRTIFGFQEAVELWPGNSAAMVGLGEARLAYGQCAYDKGDYDLCLQTLNQRVPAEAELHAKAAKAKKAAEERERRVKSLRKTVAAVVVMGFVISSVFAGVAFKQWGDAVAAKNDAVVAKDEAVVAKDDAIEQRRIADQKTQEALDQKLIADMKKQEALDQKLIADMKTQEALDQKLIADMKKQEAIDQKLIADMKTQEAIDQKLIADMKTQEAEERAAEVELGNFRSNLALSLGQVQQSNIGDASVNLENLLKPESYKSLGARGKLPKFDNWSLQRVKLLSNSGLLSERMGQVSAVAFAANANLGVVATTEAGKGNLQVVRLENKELKVIQSRATESTVESIAIAPDGDEIVYSLTSSVDKATVYSWRLSDGSSPAKVARNAGRSLQGFAVTADQVVAGINGGIWVWAREKNWQDSEPKQINNVRGRLLSLQLIDDSTAIALSLFKNEPRVYVVNLKQSSGSPVELNVKDSEFEKETLSAIAFASDKLVLGTASGKLFSVEMKAADTEVGPGFKQLLPQKHQSSIKSIRVHTDGTILTSAIEPVVQVWKPSTTQLSGWRYDTFLAGTPDNVGGATFMTNSNLILGVGQQGHAIVWDVLRQKQRSQLVPIAEDGTPIVQKSPIIDVVTSADNSRAVSIHQDGTVDAWNLINGKILGEGKGAGNALSFVGHSPGATFVDMAISEKAQIMVTSALLPEAVDSKETALRTWEFCKWDLTSSKMTDRWTEQSETEQQISLLDSGELLLYASNDKTIVKEARSDGKRRFYNDQLGTFFAVQNPSDEHLSILVKRSGAVRMFDSQKADGGFSNPGYRINFEAADNSRLLSDDDFPLIGLTTGRDLSGKDILKMTDATDKATARLSSRWQLDLKVREQGGVHLVYVATRLPGNEGKTQLMRLAFPLDEKGRVAVNKSEEMMQRYRFVLTDSPAPAIEVGSINALPISSSEVVATRTVGKTSYCATAAGTVYRIQDNQSTTLGRPETIAGGGNLAADRIVTLHQGGTLWRADWKDGKWDWNQLTGTSANADRIEMSPDGGRLLIGVQGSNGERQLLLAETESGKVLETLDQVQCGKWGTGNEIAIVLKDGTIETRSSTGAKKIGNLGANLTAQSLHYFSESWNDAGQAATKWLAVQTLATDGGSELHYYPLDVNAAADDSQKSIALAKDTVVLACSPTDGIFVTGGKGVVGVYFASPSLRAFGQPLFNLEGHAGADIKCLKFSHDGKTIISTDDRSRIFGWLSEDSLGGIAEIPKMKEVKLPVQ
jgi:WD40 repeat protein